MGSHQGTSPSRQRGSQPRVSSGYRNGICSISAGSQSSTDFSGAERLLDIPACWSSVRRKVLKNSDTPYCLLLLPSPQELFALALAPQILVQCCPWLALKKSLMLAHIALLAFQCSGTSLPS